MSERKAGWYWCRISSVNGWMPLEYDGNRWVVGAIDCQSDVIEEGPRVLPPDEEGVDMSDVIKKERKRFESWAVSKWAKNNSMHASIVLERGKDGEYCSLMTRGAWIGWQAACPDGWQCVPKELDEGMTESVMWAVDESRLQGMWTDLLSAAPKPGEL